MQEVEGTTCLCQTGFDAAHEGTPGRRSWPTPEMTQAMRLLLPQKTVTIFLPSPAAATPTLCGVGVTQIRGVRERRTRT